MYKHTQMEKGHVAQRDVSHLQFVVRLVFVEKGLTAVKNRMYGTIKMYETCFFTISDARSTANGM